MSNRRALILFVTCASLFACACAAPPKPAKVKDEAKGSRTVATTPFTLDDVFNSSFYYRSFSIDWVDGRDVYVYQEDDGSIFSFDMATNTSLLLVDSSVIADVGATRYYVSNDLRYTLLAYDVDSLWRYSFYARYKIYDRLIPQLIRFPNDDALSDTLLQFAGWAPTGDDLVFVSGNNIYYQSNPYSLSQQVTFTGKNNTLFNGVTDWLYEEEILGSPVANWWSPDNRMVCYGVFNDTDVPLFKFPHYGPKTDVYGDIVEVAYPKAGDLTPGANTKGYLYVFDTTDLSDPHVKLQPPAELVNVDHYFTRVSWRDSSTVTVVWSNRPQNHTITTICDVFTGSCSRNTNRTMVGGWISPSPSMRHIDGGDAYLTIMPRDVPDNGTWDHVAYVTSPVDAEGVITFLTGGQQEIKTVAGYNEGSRLVYYISTHDDPRKRHLFRVGTPLADPAFQTPECMTCDLAPEYDYVSAYFSSTGLYYVLSLWGPNIPNYYMKATHNNHSELKEDNADIKANLAEKTMPVIQFIQVPIGGGFTAWVKLMIPPAALEPGNSQKFPLLVDTYAGPNSQAATLPFGTGFDTYMVSSHNVVYARIDGRGTSSRGNDFKFLLYRVLYTLEIDDQIAGAKYLRDNIDYIDANKRPGISGWSYGGLASAHAVANAADVYGCAMIGAANVDHRYYDTTYSERLLGLATPEDNAGGYDGTDITRKVELFRNKTILVVHGTADDNVHFASSMQLAKALIDEDIQFRMQAYPDLNHYFSGGSRHLYSLYTDFWLNECWAIPSVKQDQISH